MSDDAKGLSAALADRYRIEYDLGVGGLATVYLAYDIKHERKVALKVLNAELAATVGHDRARRVEAGHGESLALRELKARLPPPY